ncbi:hypothetical protein A2886_01320 [candidate division WWE3 bacterium RIFCSPHIGHO2_01_FULL_42_13]|uniref:BioF2-like acetyltransferase domain-containing protein n=1 Tax=candidate division WWE3 bacterium RIFCSPHIGHO2_01_FULL_42_13 TaxID=1802617 RepID=A0A1F4USK1_UNCKA|nr:MAG: hypothetical protein A2886_01320 [candidate division WWE3 bacterium RIFCSPHIGHO2_01_FULL_42_13]
MIRVAKLLDIRQSDEWQKYLSSLGWKYVVTSSGVKVSLLKTFIGTVTKIQKPPVLSESDLNEIEEICKKAGAMFIKIEPGLGQNIELLEGLGYKKSYHPLSPPSTILIDLTKSEEELWTGVSKSAKYLTKRARREDAKIEIYQRPNEEILKSFVELTLQTQKARKVTPPTLEDLKKKVEIFGDRSYLSLAKNPAGEIMVGNLSFGFGKGIWFVHGGTSDRGRHGRWGYELFWQQFLYFKAHGYEVLDMEGVDDDRFPHFTKTWGGFSYFKEKFGGERVQFPYPYIKLLSPVLKLLGKVYATIPL